MKTLGKLALIFTALFLVLTICGAILTVLGAADLTANGMDIRTEIINILENAGQTAIHYNDDDYEWATDEASVTDTAGINSIEVNGAVYDVQIMYNSDHSLRVCFTGNSWSAEPISITNVGSDGLLVSFDSIENYTWSLGDGCEIIVFLPNDYSGELVLNGNLGEVDIDNLALGRLVLNGTMGEVDFNGSLGSVSLNGCMGEIDIELLSNLTDSSEISGNMGSINIDFPANSALNISQEGNLGNVKIKDIALSSSAPELVIEGNMGEVVIEHN